MKNRSGWWYGMEVQPARSYDGGGRWDKLGVVGVHEPTTSREEARPWTTNQFGRVFVRSRKSTTTITNHQSLEYPNRFVYSRVRASAFILLGASRPPPVCRQSPLRNRRPARPSVKRRRG